jgi:hypothetical protein
MGRTMNYYFTGILMFCIFSILYEAIMKRQHNTMLIAILGTILLGLSSYVLMTIVELQVHLGMLTEEIMSIDKQIGRIYNHMDRLISK